MIRSCSADCVTCRVIRVTSRRSLGGRVERDRTKRDRGINEVGKTHKTRGIGVPRIIQLRIPAGIGAAVSDKGREALGRKEGGTYMYAYVQRAHDGASSIARDGLSTDRVIM